MTIELFKTDPDGDFIIFAVEIPAGGFTLFYDKFFRTAFFTVFNRDKAIFSL
jgi:hypothetical protein